MVPAILDLNRCHRLAMETIRVLGLDLSGLAVLTEAATGVFALTASLAALAGANRVFVVGRNSRYGTAQEAVAQTLVIGQQWDCVGRIEMLPDRESPKISEADIVTNLGALRPLDDAFLARLKSTAVIPLMFETWEYRPEDLDLDGCRRRGISVLGTNERYPGVEVLSYLGPLAVRLVLEVGLEVFRSRIVVLGSGVFADVSAAALRALGADVDALPVSEDGTFDDRRAIQVLRQADALLVAEHRSRKPLLGASCALDGSRLAGLNAGLAVVHIAGAVDQAGLAAAGIRVHPETVAPPSYMSANTAYVGPAPVIRLHAAGLKVGEIMARLRKRGLRPAETEREALGHALCQGFAHYGST
jgi:hypothetical protein